MACNFCTRRAMFIFQETAPWRPDCHAGLKSRQNSHRRTGLGRSTPSTRHLPPGARGCSCYLSDTEQCGSFPYPNTSWHWRLHRSQGSGGRPGMCSLPEQLTTTGAESLSGSRDVSRPSRMGRRVKGLWLKSILCRKIFFKCLTTLWNHTGSVLLSVGVVQTHLCFMQKTRKRKIQLCRASLLYSQLSKLLSFLPTCL